MAPVAAVIYFCAESVLFQLPIATDVKKRQAPKGKETQ